MTYLRRGLLAVGVVIAMGACASTAWAYFTSTGTGSAAATVGTLTVPVITSASQPTPGVGTVHLEWSTSSAPGDGAVGYYVQRLGSPSVFACGTSSTPPLLTATSCDDTGVAVGSHSYLVTAVWRSWTSSGASTAVSVVKADTTTTVVSTTGSPSAAGQVVTYTATVSVTSPGAGTPTGDIAFYDSGTPIGACGSATGTATSGSVAACQVTYAGVGGHTITARYLGGPFHDVSPTSAAITQVVARAGTTTSLTVTGSPVTYGNEQAATFSASVTPVFAGTPTGSIAVKQATTTLCTITLPGTSCTTAGATLGAGTHSITAAYSGDADHATSTSVAQNLVVDKAPLTVTASSGSMTYGGAVPTIIAGYAGFVTGEGPGHLTTQPTCSTTATSTSPVSGSPYASSCTGGASTNYSFSYVAGSVTVSKASQAITITSTAPANATVGGATYTITATGGGSGNPVTFTSATSPVCTVSGSTVSFVAAGSCTINADQAGGPNHNAALQVTQSFSVSAATVMLNIDTVVRDGGNKKVHFTGTGTPGASITISICTVNSFPCSASPTNNLAGTATVATVAANGSWTSTQSSNNLAASQTYWARAVQSGPSTTSSVFQFSTTNL